MNDPSPVLAETLSGRYTITRELGSGGMAVVYLAHDIKHDRDVAIKVLRSELTASLGRERFLREIRVTAKLSHPHIVPLYDSGEASGFLYFVMPFVEGESLRDLLDREKQIPIEDAVRIAREAGEALEFAHSEGIIHRDVKPENILLSGGHALVADFGIAGALSAAGGDRLTSTGMALGTPAYMSPEQATGEEPDARSDLYGLGCVLYEMLTGQPPFVGHNPQTTLARHAVDDVPSIRAVRPTTPPALETLVFHSLAKAPADRFKTAARFVEALASTDANPVHTGSGPVASRRSLNFRERTRSLIWGGVAAVVVLIGGWMGISSMRDGPGAGGALSGGLDPNRMAILFMEDLTHGRDLGLIARGLTEGLIDRLTLVPTLDVVSRNGVAQFAGTGTAPDVIARELSAGTLVRGAIESLQDSVRTTVRLIDGESGVDFAAGAFTVPQGQFLAVRDSLLVLVERLIRERLGEQFRVMTERSQAQNDEAWLLLQRGERVRSSLDSLLLDGDEEVLEAAYHRADSLFALAESLDPTWSEPATHRAWMEYEHARWRGTSDLTWTDRWTTEGLEHARRALSLDSLSADAFEARGILRYWRWLLGLEPDREASRELFDSAEEDLRTAIALNPRQASAWSTLSHLLINKSGDRSSQSQARLAAERAMEADSYLQNADVVIRRLYLVSYDMEDIVRARRWCLEGANRFPQDPNFVECQIMIMTFDSVEHEANQAWRLADAFVELHAPANQQVARLRANMMVAAVLAQAGLTDSARAVIDRSKGDPSIDPTRDLLMLGAFAHTRMASYDQAVALLAEFISANPIFATDLTTSEYWWWRGLQDHPGFQALAQLGGELGR